ncbi:MAG TPA: hypothetical protein VF538_13875 [Pyrinomonadaceae bacterium]|jgi:hypothetical protein
MTKKVLSFALSALLLNLCGAGRVLAATKDKRGGDDATAKRETSGQEAADAKAVEKVKRKVAEIGTGRELVAVKLREQGKNVGYISEIAEDHFMLTDSKDGTTIKVDYADVKSVRRSHLTADNMKVLGIVSVGLMAAVLVGVVVAASRE